MAARFNRKEKKTGTWQDGTTWTQKTVRQLTIADAVSRVLKELGTFGVLEGDAIIFSNLQCRLDGLPRSGQQEPDDPGAAVYWKRQGDKKHHVMAIDQYDRVADNLGAIAATLNAMRAIERHGGAMILERAFTGFEALPAPKGWREVFNVNGEATLAQVKMLYRKLALQRHPDTGGSQAAMAELNSAFEQAQHEISQ